METPAQLYGLTVEAILLAEAFGAVVPVVKPGVTKLLNLLDRDFASTDPLPPDDLEELTDPAAVLRSLSFRAVIDFSSGMGYVNGMNEDRRQAAAVGPSDGRYAGLIAAALIKEKKARQQFGFFLGQLNACAAKGFASVFMMKPWNWTP